MTSTVTMEAICGRLDGWQFSVFDLAAFNLYIRFFGILFPCSFPPCVYYFCLK